MAFYFWHCFGAFKIGLRTFIVQTRMFFCHPCAKNSRAIFASGDGIYFAPRYVLEIFFLFYTPCYAAIRRRPCQKKP